MRHGPVRGPSHHNPSGRGFELGDRLSACSHSHPLDGADPGLGRRWPVLKTDGDRYGAQARDQDVDRQDHDRVIPCVGKARIPDVASERLHRLLRICCNHACWQWSCVPRIELVVSGGDIHLASAPVKQAQPFPD